MGKYSKFMMCTGLSVTQNNVETSETLNIVAIAYHANSPASVCNLHICSFCWNIAQAKIMIFHYPILSCFWKIISISDPNPVLVEIVLSVSENYPKMYDDAQHIFLCFVYFASW